MLIAHCSGFLPPPQGWANSPGDFSFFQETWNCEQPLHNAREERKHKNFSRPFAPSLLFSGLTFSSVTYIHIVLTKICEIPGRLLLLLFSPRRLLRGKVGLAGLILVTLTFHPPPTPLINLIQGTGLPSCCNRIVQTTLFFL